MQHASAMQNAAMPHTRHGNALPGLTESHDKAGSRRVVAYTCIIDPFAHPGAL